MFFNTINEYDEKLDEINVHLSEMKESIEKNPDKEGIKINYDGLKYIFDLISNDRENFLKMTNENVNVHIGSVSEDYFCFEMISNVFKDLNNINYNLTNRLKIEENLKLDQLIPVINVTSGSLHMSFSMGDENTDLSDMMLNYQIFQAYFDIFGCSDEDLPKLKEKYGDECIESYKDFLGTLIENKLDITLENSSRTVRITHEDASRICDILNGN